MCIGHQQLWCRVRLFTLPIARSNDTQWLSDKSCRHWLPPILKAQSATRWKPRLWPKSSQRSTLVPKVSLGGEEKQQWRHVLRTTDVWTCRGPPVQTLCNRWFALSLSHKSKRPTWHPTQWSMLLCHWMHPNANATLTITMTLITTIIVTCQHTHKTTAPLQLNRLQQATISWYWHSRSWSQNCCWPARW